MVIAYNLAKKMFGHIPGFEPGQTPELMPYQVTTANRLVANRKHLNGLPMGAGKTLPSVEALSQWNADSCLLIPPQRAVMAWLKTMWIWYPDLLKKFAIIGKEYTKEQRKQFWEEHKAKKTKMHCIVNPQIFVRDLPYIPTHWDVLMADEYHKYMRNHGTKMHEGFKKMKTEATVLVSGSPISKGAQDLFVPLNLFDPKLFGSYWKYARTWCHIDETPFGKTVYGVRNVEQFRKVRAPYVTIATKKELGLQKKVRDIFPVEMSDSQRRAYDSIKEDFILDLEEGGSLVMLNTLDSYIKLRKILCCPAMLDPSLGVGAAAETIFDILQGYDSDQQHCAIFVPFRAALPILKAYFESLGRPVYILAGGMDVLELHETVQAFKRNKGIVLCTVNYAESFDLETTDKAFFCGWEWDPQQNFQAEDRLDRMNNEHGLINIYYSMHLETIEEENMMSTMIRKQNNVRLIYEGYDQLLSALRNS